jgi:hypothetical protein
MAAGFASEPIRKLKPGKARLITALVTADTTLPLASVVVLVVGPEVDWLLVIEPWLGFRPSCLLVM